MVLNIILQLECNRWHPSSQSMCKTCQLKRSLNDNSTQHHRWAAKFVCSNSYCYLKCQIWSFPNSSMCHPCRCSSAVFAPQGPDLWPCSSRWRSAQLSNWTCLNLELSGGIWCTHYPMYIFRYQMPRAFSGVPHHHSWTDKVTNKLLSLALKLVPNLHWSTVQMRSPT